MARSKSRSVTLSAQVAVAIFAIFVVFIGAERHLPRIDDGECVIKNGTEPESAPPFLAEASTALRNGGNGSGAVLVERSREIQVFEAAERLACARAEGHS